MLTAAQIEALRAKSEKLVDPITEFLIEDIAKRIAQAGQFTATASYETWKLQQMGISQRKLKKEIAKRLGVSLKEAEKLLTQAAETGYNFDMSSFPTTQAIPLSANSSLQQILDATVKLAKEDLTNMTQTIGFVGPDGQCRELTGAYNAACDYAFQKVSTGAQDYQSAIRDATRNLAEKGIRTIDYESGVHTSMEAAVRRNIMGGLGLMQEQISESNHDLLGCDGWEISAHAGSAPDHELIQGKQYSDKEYKELNNSLVRRIGTLNCGHAAFPIIMGVNSPQYTEEELEEFRQQNEEGVTFEGKHYTLYEATQRQRKFERSIRKQKRRILVDEATEDKDKLQTDQIRLVRLRQEYARFSKGVGLPMQHARMETAGFDWKKGKVADSAAKVHINNSLSSGRLSNGKAKNQITGNTAVTTAVNWDNSIGTQSWGIEARRNLYATEESSAKLNKEEGVLFDTEGNMLLRKGGDENHVTFLNEEIKKMRGGVLTHNHPDSSCFSYNDINMLRYGKLAELRVTTKEGIYRIQAPKKWSKDILTLEKIEKVYYDIDAEISPSFYSRAHAGEFSFWDAELLGQRATIEELCKKYDIPFAFDKWSVTK